MRQVAALTAMIVILIVIVLPAIIVRGIPAATVEQPRTKVHKGEDIPIKVYLHEADKIVEMNLEEYVKGVVAAEMPAEFELEALKAQAVAARTYAVKQMALFGGSGLPDRPGADVSTDHRQSQAWLSEAQLRQRWGPFKSDLYWQKISQAVEETRGLILTYSGEPIHAVFHSTSGERTASALEVWGFDYPYLKSVPCKWDQKSPRYADTREITLTELEQRLGADAGVLAAAKTGETGIAQVLDRTESGRVDKVRIGAKTFSGTAVREKLDLRSANFIVETKEDRLVFKTIGYGHGVGLCQYGANGMAKEGRTFREILTYYYTGVAIRDIHGS
ncbi:stage II sporulation protein D [Sporolituus thermophilus]|uniref:Stage II sporulation protein D n=1 Tax=Sporolituus thermophilus DSM 23256 TaxID=1123285 RepID=A0A1G7HGB7_9FIRM|nr:stage II sporulation protein D [Sporolituus thermophilus]SDE99512.1 stage II sporulation protein D [Sporolituus thermophilus DSM 23256]